MLHPHLPASEKRLAPLREHRGAALPGQALVVYDPDSGLVIDIVASENAHQSERASVAPLLDSAQPGQLWIADRHFCTRVIMQCWDEAHASFIVREHGRHPRLAGQGDWHGCGRTGTGEVREQAIEVAGARWRRIELALDTPTEAGERVISPARLRAGRLWSNLPEEISAARIAELYRTRWRVERSRSPGIEGMFQRLEGVLHSEIRSLGHPRAALLGFVVSVLAYNVLAPLQRCVERAHQEQEPPPEGSTYHLALHIRSGHEGMLIALPPEQWRPDGLGRAAVAVGPQHRSPSGRHQQARTQGRQAQGIRRWRCRARPRFHRSRPGPGPDNALKRVPIRANGLPS